MLVRPWKYFGRVLCLLLGWVFCAVFAVLCHVLQHSVDQESYQGEAAGGRLIPKAASLLLPRAVYLSEVLAMLFVFGLPLWPLLGALQAQEGNDAYVLHPGSVFGTTKRDPFGTIADGVNSIVASAWVWNPSCGTYSDYLIPFYNSTAQADAGCDGWTGRWWQMPYKVAFNESYSSEDQAYKAGLGDW
ncbi:unnamed protein product [Amoebophrya sp. A120]|nr:unnamed protein product [Amoebophrya sp. A120]|eukprot:GSA120T00000847001.1